jgi:3-deoxy-D-manno-octulosonate 8-phosphate phosphatase (KDO 8-P phosphatase)
MGIMKRVGLSVAVADADYRIRDIADIVTRVPGGRGAVRELCEMILKGRNLLEKGLEPFTDETE